MKRYFIILITLILIFIKGLSADEVKFIASAKNMVRAGERFSLTYTLNAEGSEFRGPLLKNFNILTGPNSSSSSSIQIINGNVTRAVEYSFSYILVAPKEGTFEINPATIKVKGKTYKSNLLKIRVVKGSATTNQNQQGTSNSQKGSSQQQTSSNKNKDNDVFLKTIVNKKNPLQGEQIIVTCKIYTKIPISNLNIKKMSSFPGFWSKNLLDENKRLSQYTEYINGEEYIVADIRKIALFPLKSGKLTIAPLDLECTAQIRKQTQKRQTRDPFFDSFFNDPFFNRSYQNVDLELKSNSLIINVKPLHLRNKPANFNGSVGNFSFKSSIDNTKLKTNEAINLKFVISGKGNIELINNPDIEFPPDFEVYDPKISKNISTTQSGVSGTKIFEYLLIPRNPGEFKIKPVNFSYYDLTKKRYITLSSPEYTITVEKGEGTFSNITYSGVNQEDIKYIGSDIRHIKSYSFHLQKIGFFFFNSSLYYILLFTPFVLFILFIILWKKQLKNRSNIILMKNKKATKIARKRLKKASEFLKENKNEEFYIEISQALWGYLSDKFSIPLSELSMDSVNDALIKKNVKEEIIKQFIDTLNNCEFARFAPGESSTTMENIYNEALNIISKIERELK
ncbi:MAG: BatD family protein [Bacteroidales bacterium]|nr:BatD family protein [Bacteroidales bacterium]